MRRGRCGWTPHAEQWRRRHGGNIRQRRWRGAPPVGAGRGGIGGLRRGTKALAMRGPRPTTSSTSAGAGSDDDDAKDEVVGRRQTRTSSRGGGAASPMRAASASTAATSGKAPLPPVGKSWWHSIPFLPPPHPFSLLPLFCVLLGSFVVRLIGCLQLLKLHTIFQCLVR